MDKTRDCSIRPEPVRIAMWSGPRNISTALMRAFESRGDTYVCDEPFYAFYLAQTGAPHPGAAEVIAHHETDWRKVVEFLTGPVPENRPVFYQKQMTHHMLPEIELDWLRDFRHCFLIREPREMLMSLDEKTPNPGVDDTGLPQQTQLYLTIADMIGAPPPVVDSKDLLMNPAGILAVLCESWGLEFTDAMLSWEPGERATDGVWAKHWYNNVLTTSGFEPYRPKEQRLAKHLEAIYEASRPYYECLYEHRVVV